MMPMRIPIKKAIDESGLKKSYIAEKLGVSAGYFAEFISKPDKLTIKQVNILCNLLGKEINDIDWNC